MTTGLDCQIFLLMFHPSEASPVPSHCTVPQVSLNLSCVFSLQKLPLQAHNVSFSFSLIIMMTGLDCHTLNNTFLHTGVLLYCPLLQNDILVVSFLFSCTAMTQLPLLCVSITTIYPFLHTRCSPCLFKAITLPWHGFSLISWYLFMSQTINGLFKTNVEWNWVPEQQTTLLPAPTAIQLSLITYRYHRQLSMWLFNKIDSIPLV